MLNRVAYGCRGVLLRTDAEQRPLFDQWYAVEQRGMPMEAESFLAMLHSDAQHIANNHGPEGFKLFWPEVRIHRAVYERNWEELRRLAFPLIRLRGEMIGRPCGYLLTELVEAVPADGGEHTVVCPRCGNTVSVRKG